MKLDYLDNSPSLQPIPTNINLGAPRTNVTVTQPSTIVPQPATTLQNTVSKNSNFSLILVLIIIIVATVVFVYFCFNDKIKEE